MTDRSERSTKDNRDRRDAVRVGIVSRLGLLVTPPKHPSTTWVVTKPDAAPSRVFVSSGGTWRLAVDAAIASLIHERVPRSESMSNRIRKMMEDGVPRTAKDMCHELKGSNYHSVSRTVYSLGLTAVDWIINQRGGPTPVWSGNPNAVAKKRPSPIGNKANAKKYAQNKRLKRQAAGAAKAAGGDPFAHAVAQMGNALKAKGNPK